MSAKIISGSVLAIMLLLASCTNAPVKSTSSDNTTSNAGKAFAVDREGKRYPIDISKADHLSIKPEDAEIGSNAEFTLQIWPQEHMRIPGFFTTDTVTAATEWSLIPDGHGVYVDAKTGTFHVSTDAKHNSDYQVIAKIKGREKTVTSKLRIYSKNANPLIGRWSEQGNQIAELVFSPNLQFSVTTHLFESYKDYWGTYTVNPEKRQLNMKITGGNKIPTDANISNISYSFNAEGQLMLQNIFFGTLNEGDKKKSQYLFKAAY